MKCPGGFLMAPSCCGLTRRDAGWSRTCSCMRCLNTLSVFMGGFKDEMIKFRSACVNVARDQLVHVNVPIRKA